MKTVHAFVSGHVQGVSFRWHVRKWAHQLGIAGWVRNLEDGRVELQAQGERLEEFLQHVRRGPEGSRVTSVREDWPDGPPLGTFEIR
ncbi:hypothetical protein ABS71_08320 [bacterium SCN 62-11]|nr:acylphosphatase [Candidatus Eremiobacteraeota bacterium]ODT70977.1 MAG: hypothetical protein ABS71_08320 [bacterium SCN 62-11]